MATDTLGAHLVKLLRAPVNSVVSMGLSDETIIFGTITGTLHVHALQIGPGGKPYFALQGKELVLNEMSVPIDAILVNPAGNVAACFTQGNTLTFVKGVGRNQNYVAPSNGSGITPPRPGRYMPDRVGTLCNIALPGKTTYTNRAAAHCWVDASTIVVGCVDGSLIMIVIDVVGESVLTVDAICSEDAPIVQLSYDSTSETLCVSTLARSGLIVNCRRGMDFADVAFTQIGVKPRAQGLYGACYAPHNQRVYAARPSRRIFEADATSGSVFKTFKLPECKSELSLLKVASSTMIKNDAGEEELVLISEAPQFLGLIALGPQSNWKLAMPQVERAVVCGAQFRNFHLFLCSDDQVLSVETGPAMEEAPPSDSLDIASPAVEAHTPLKQVQITETGSPVPDFQSAGETDSAANSVVEGRPPTQLAMSSPPPGQSVGDHAADFAAPKSSDGSLQIKVKPTRQQSPKNNGDSSVKEESEQGPDGVTTKTTTTTKISSAASATSGGKRVVRVVTKKRVIRRAKGTGPGDSGSAIGDDDTDSIARKTSNLSPRSGRSASEVNTPRTETDPASPSMSTTDFDRPPTPDVEPTAPKAREPVVEEAITPVTESPVPAPRHADPSPPPPAPAPAVANEPPSPLARTQTPREQTKPIIQDKTPTPPPSPPRQAAPEPEQEPARPPTPPPPKPHQIVALEAFVKETKQIHATHDACGLDKTVQPRLMKEIIGWCSDLENRLNDRTTGPDEVKQTVRKYFAEGEGRKQVVDLLVAGIEYCAYVRLPEGEDAAILAGRLFRAVERLNLSDEDDVCNLCEQICKAISGTESLFAVAARVAALCVMSDHPEGFPRLDSPDADAWDLMGSDFAPLEQMIVASSSEIVEALQFREYSLCATIHYFPYIFAVLPSKAIHVAMATFPAMTIKYIQWSLSGHVQTQAVQVLRRCRSTTATRMDPDDLADCLCDFVLMLATQHKDRIVAGGPAFPLSVEILLARRMVILEKEGLTATPAPGTPTSRVAASQGKPGMPSIVTVRKLRRLDDTVLDLLKTCKLKLNVAFPDLREVFERYSFPRGIVELRAIEDSIEDAVKFKRIDRLLPLFQLDDVIVESNWIALFVSSHSGDQLERAVYLCLTVVQQPKRVRYLLRRAFPYLDSPGIEDEQLRCVVEKLTMLIN